MIIEDILFSIQPKYMKLILLGSKKIEYRNNFFNCNYPNWFYVYESKPSSQIKYCILLDKPFIKGENISIKTYGVDRFNKQEMKRKFAYPILKVMIIDKPINLIKLKSIGVTPPQNYIYIQRNEELNKLIFNSSFHIYEQQNLFN